VQFGDGLGDEGLHGLRGAGLGELFEDVVRCLVLLAALSRACQRIHT
jgi:hypothetical protein